MRKHLTYVTALSMAASLILQAPVYAALEDDGFTAVPETCEGEELVLTESVVDISFTNRDKNAGYEDYTEVELSDEEVLVDGEALSGMENASSGGIKFSQEDHIMTITEEGVYLLSGSFSDGQILVDTEDTAKVQLVLDNVDIHCENHAAIWIKSADKVFLTLADGSENAVSDGGQETGEASQETLEGTPEETSGEISEETPEETSGEISEETLEETPEETSEEISEETPDGTGQADEGIQTDTTAVSDEHADADGAIFSKADLTIQGTGSLTVNGNYKHGIVSKDDLVITGGNLNVTAAENCLAGKDAVKIADGTIHLEAKQHAIKAKNEDDTQQGNVYLEGGKITASAVEDGINATGSIVITGGELEFSVQDDGIHSDKDLVIYNGVVRITQSCEGLEGHRISIFGGTFDVVSSDDGMNASGGMESQEEEAFVKQFRQGDRKEMQMPENGEAPQMPENGEVLQMPEGMEAPENGEALQMPEGMEQPESGEAPQMPEGMEAPENGEALQMPEGMEQPESGEAPQMPEGMEQPESGEALQMPENGEMPQNEEGMQQMPMGGGMRGGMRGGMHDGMQQWQEGEGMGHGGMDSDSEAYIRICGGNIKVDANGDGLDSNGYFYMEGGTVLVAGPTGGADSALDYGLTAEASGGTVVAAGSSGMAQGFSKDSLQGNFLYSFSENIPAESIVSLKTDDGEEIVSWRCQKAFQSVVITSPELKAGNTYILTAGEQEVEINI